MRKNREILGDVAVELGWLAEINMEVRTWDFNEVGSLILVGTGTGDRRQFAVTDIG